MRLRTSEHMWRRSLHVIPKIRRRPEASRGDIQRRDEGSDAGNRFGRSGCGGALCRGVDESAAVATLVGRLASRPRARSRVSGTLERVLRRNPDHPGANHYYIHAVEASKNPERALPSALRLGSLVPGAGHLVHMPSHIFLRLGDFQTSATEQLTASEVDRKYMERTDADRVSIR